MMRIIFMGTPEFAVASLEALLEAGMDIAAVVTAEDKPAGRGRKMQESAVKQSALKHGLPVLQPQKLKNPEFIDRLKSFRADLFVVVAFRMLPEEVWSIPPLGTINLHASLLPEYRGAAPINWAIINGETCTGTTVFFINEEIDKGNIISYSKEDIYPADNAGALHDRLMAGGAKHLVKAVQSLSAGNYRVTPQNEVPENSGLKSAPKIFRETCRINWDQDIVWIQNHIRGLSPYPAAWTTITNVKGEELTVKIYESDICENAHSVSPGTIDSDNRTFLKIAGRNGWIEIKSLQMEGKKRMNTGDFLRGMLIRKD
jgi:methionyl-tRNA formyltransferase